MLGTANLDPVDGDGLTDALSHLLEHPRVIDPLARSGTWGFRLLILPGSALFWPLLAKRWFGGAPTPPEERTAHRVAAVERES